jgi:hypothetical protein
MGCSGGLGGLPWTMGRRWAGLYCGAKAMCWGCGGGGCCEAGNWAFGGIGDRDAEDLFAAIGLLRAGEGVDWLGGASGVERPFFWAALILC